MYQQGHEHKVCQFPCFNFACSHAALDWGVLSAGLAFAAERCDNLKEFEPKMYYHTVDSDDVL